MDPLQAILENSKTIAIVGISSNPAKPSYEVAEYLQRSGYKIIPVNPNEIQVLGEKAYPDLATIPEPVDIVDIFRSPEHVLAIVAQAIQKKAKVVWMQPGAENYEAAEMATAAGLQAVVGMCMRTRHRRTY